MNNLLDMLTKAGYEISSIGSDVLPCTLRLGNEPIGFLMEDLSVRLLPDSEKERDRIQPVLSFAAENQGIEQIQDEFKLSEYQNIFFTAGFDYDSSRPVYNIYSMDKENNLTLLNSFDDREAAARDYVSRSGLVSGEIPSPARKINRIRQFMDAVKEKGFQIRESHEESHRAFDITDKDGRVVGYIGKDNKVTVTSENGRVKRTLTNTYLETNPVMLPSFFEKLKERLKEIGLALKVIFTPKGRHYAIHNKQHQEVATVSEKDHTVSYTDAVTEDQKAKIDALVEELRRDSHDKEQPQQDHEKETVQEAAEEKESSVSAKDVRRTAEAILTDPALTEVFLQTVLSNPEFVARLNEKMAEALEKASITKEAPAATEKANPSAEKLKQEFERDYSYMQTMFGFNPEKYDAMKAEMTARFGTADPKEFQAMLEQGAFENADTLQGRLKTSKRVADLKNVRTQSEKTQEKERA